MNTGYTQLNLRLTPEEKAAIEAAAKRDMRSVNSWIRVTLAKYIKKA